MLHPYQVKLNLGGKPDLPPKPNRHLIKIIEEDEPSENSEKFSQQDADEKNNGFTTSETFELDLNNEFSEDFLTSMELKANIDMLEKNYNNNRSDSNSDNIPASSKSSHSHDHNDLFIEPDKIKTIEQESHKNMNENFDNLDSASDFSTKISLNNERDDIFSSSLISEDIPTHDFNLPEPPKSPLNNHHPVVPVPVIGLGTKKNQRIKSFSGDDRNNLLQKGPIMRTQSEKTGSNPFLDFKRCGSIENLRAIQRGEHKNHFLSQNSNQTDKSRNLENQFRINQKPFKPILQRSQSFTDLNQSLSSWRSPRLSVKRKELPFTLTVSNENLAALELELDHDNESQKNSLESSDENDNDNYNNGEFTELQVEMVSITEENSSSVLSDILEEPTEIESSGTEGDFTEKSLESETLSSVESCIRVKIEPPEGQKKSEEDILTSESAESLSSEHQVELPNSKLNSLQPNERFLPESFSSSNASSTTNLPVSETIEEGSCDNTKLPESKLNTLQTDEKMDINSLVSSYTSDTQSKFENVLNDQNENENDNKQFKLIPLFKNQNTKIEHNNFLNNSITENTNISSNPNLSVGYDILHKTKIGDETATEHYYLNQLDYLKSNKNNIFNAAEGNNQEPRCNNNNFIMDGNSPILCDEKDQDNHPIPLPRTITYEAPLDLAPAPGHQLPDVPTTTSENTTNNNNFSQQLESQETSEKEYEFNTIPPVKGSSKLDRDFSHNEFWKKFMERNNMEGMDDLNVSSNYLDSSLKNNDSHYEDPDPLVLSSTLSYKLSVDRTRPTRNLQKYQYYGSNIDLAQIKDSSSDQDNSATFDHNNLTTSDIELSSPSASSVIEVEAEFVKKDEDNHNYDDQNQIDQENSLAETIDRNNSGNSVSKSKMDFNAASTFTRQNKDLVRGRAARNKEMKKRLSGGSARSNLSSGSSYVETVREKFENSAVERGNSVFKKPSLERIVSVEDSTYGGLDPVGQETDEYSQNIAVNDSNLNVQSIREPEVSDDQASCKSLEEEKCTISNWVLL